MAFGFFKKKDEEVKQTPAAKPEAPEGAAITMWCGKNKETNLAKLFFSLKDRGMPAFSSDSEAVS